MIISIFFIENSIETFIKKIVFASLNSYLLSSFILLFLGILGVIGCICYITKKRFSKKIVVLIFLTFYIIYFIFSIETINMFIENNDLMKIIISISIFFIILVFTFYLFYILIFSRKQKEYFEKIKHKSN